MATARTKAASRGASLWSVSLVTTAEAEDALAAALAACFGETPTSFTKTETGEITLTVFLQRSPGSQERVRRTFAPHLERIRAAQLNPGAARLRVGRVRREDWAESWKKHFPPLSFGRKLLVQPGWSRRRPQPGQALVTLDPGLSFGTGQHPTTSFCLRELVAFHKTSSPQSFLDLGTGSGILAIAAAKLGYAPVAALEFDPEALAIARENARQNGVGSAIAFQQADVTKLPLRGARGFSLVCANLISNLLIAERRRITTRVAPGGRLVLAGILQTEFAQVCRAYEDCGFVLLRSRRLREWESGTFVTK